MCLKTRLPRFSLQTKPANQQMMRMPSNASFNFHKMHGAGNDFILIDLRKQQLVLTPELARTMADRHLGIGCDQLLIVYEPLDPTNIARYEILNSDGSHAGQCGNGARCIALYLGMTGEIGDDTFALESPSGLIHIDRCPDGEFEIDMGEPNFEPGVIPVNLRAENGRFQLDSDQGPMEFGAVSMGNPHALLEVDDIANAGLDTTGAWLSQHEIFPRGCNVGFAEIQDRNNIRLRVYERGSGETLACGSGACAAVAILRRENRLAHEVNVLLPGGHLVIKWPGIGSRIRMKGPATHVFRGTVSHE